MEFRETALTEITLSQLIALSEDWAAEDSCWGYRPNTAQDLHGRRLFCAYDEDNLIGYLFGLTESSQKPTSIMPAGTQYFELEELYVRPQYRSQGIGRKLFSLLESSLESTETEFILLSTATKNYRAILHFYLDELGLDFWSARLFKRISPK